MRHSMQFENELEGQVYFLRTYLPRIDHNLSIEDIQHDYSDGIIRGNILEFKLNISDLNAALFQTIKYLSHMRIKGKPIPANILLISLNDSRAYLYHSKDYLNAIENVYIGASSKSNCGFVCKNYINSFDYSNPYEEAKMIEELRSDNYTKIHLDENCIVGWGEAFYRQYPEARKSDFIGDNSGKVNIVGEIRNPTKFAAYIYPYEQETNERFRYLMDKLNDFIQKKNLGAFYTHNLYAEKTLKLVRKAISRVPIGNDYVIIDRCAGTGNLEKGMTDEELSHTIVSTLEYYEYKVLLEVLGDKVRHIIPPTEHEDTFNMGMVRGADALSEEIINNPTIREYIANPNCTIILFENPPFAETTSIEHQKQKAGKQASVWKQSFVVQQMRKEIKGSAINDLGNAFIWSAFKYYLRQPTDSYIVFSPVKYWKAQHLINKEFIQGFAFNRRHFHTSIDACIMCALWSNCNTDISEFSIEALDINNQELINCGALDVKRIYTLYSRRYYESIHNWCNNGILVGLDGLEASDTVKKRIAPLYSDQMIGYLVVDGAGFDNPDLHSSLTIAGRYNGNGFFLHKDNFLEKLPMFAASRYITYNREWTERARIMKSADGAEEFERDIKSGKLNSFLLKVLLFTILEPQNHMRSFTGSDGRNYINQLTLDITNIQTVASKYISSMVCNAEERQLISVWQQILQEAKQTANYNPKLTYGLYQIKVELNTFRKDKTTGEKIYDYPSLNGNIRVLAELVRKYYLTEIVPTLFKYQFLK